MSNILKKKHLMKKSFYRVGDFNQHGLVLDSNSFNYGKSFTGEYDYFLERYFNIASKIDLPIDFLIDVNNGIAFYGDDYLKEKIEPAIVQKFYVDLFKVTANEKHRGFTIPINLINEFTQSFNEPTTILLEGKYIWENYFEMVRLKAFPELPSRKESIFLFENINDCNDYIEKHKKGFGQIYEVEIIEKEVMFKADMNIFDEIDLSITYNNLILELAKYWEGKTSEKPVYE